MPLTRRSLASMSSSAVVSQHCRWFEVFHSLRIPDQPEPRVASPNQFAATFGTPSASPSGRPCK
jgi:hypothetical protein